MQPSNTTRHIAKKIQPFGDIVEQTYLRHVERVVVAPRWIVGRQRHIRQHSREGPEHLQEVFWGPIDLDRIIRGKDKQMDKIATAAKEQEEKD